MAASKPEVLISQLPDKIERNSNGENDSFGVQELNGTIAVTARCNRKSVFKDGGRQTGSTYISAPRLDINAVPTANPHFLGPGIQRDYYEYRLR